MQTIPKFNSSLFYFSLKSGGMSVYHEEMSEGAEKHILLSQYRGIPAFK